jgi:putative tryptophan/tyrosine transport system substrate-binding protein
MRRREFISLIGGAVITRPLTARAQQSERMRRIGVLSNKSSGDAQGREEAAAFADALKTHGWIAGGNVQIDYRWGAGDGERYRTYAAELVAQAPDVLLAAGGTITGALQRATRDIPIVFVETSDPVNRGLVASLSRPGGSTTGFILFEYSLCGKWLELLKEIAPRITRAAVIRDPSEFSGVAEFAAIQAVAPSLSVDLSPIDPRDSAAVERAIKDFAHQSNGGLIVIQSGTSIKDRDRIIALAAQQRLPAVYGISLFVTAGGLISYGPDLLDQYRRAAGYVDRILKGEKPADLPVQAPTKYETVINLKTAKALGLTFRRPDDRMRRRMSAIGTKRTSGSWSAMSAFGGKADQFAGTHNGVLW